MTADDERILEYLADEGWSSPRLMSRFGVKLEKDQVQKRCKLLARVGFVVPVRTDQTIAEATKWELSPQGERYLEGEVDANLYRPLPAVRPPEGVRPGWYAEYESVRG